MVEISGPPPLGREGHGATGGRAGTDVLKALGQHLVRLEKMVLLIAQQVGVAPEAIARLLPPAAPPT